VAAPWAWLALLTGAVQRWTSVPGNLAAEARDPVYSPFLGLPAIVGMLLAIGLEPHASAGCRRG
jgi:hypothetical protein